MRRGPIGAAGLLALSIAAAAVLAACAGPTVTATPSIAPSPAATTAASPSQTASAGILVDETLIALLPSQVAGIAVVSDPATAASIAADPNLAIAASAMAVGLAVGPGSSDQGAEDLAIVSVVQLRPDVFDDDFFRSWRDSYDAAACEAAGGVQGNAQAEIAGHDTYIGTCVQGAFTYHTYLEDRNVLISITSVGTERLGEQVVAGLGE